MEGEKKIHDGWGEGAKMKSAQRLKSLINAGEGGWKAKKRSHALSHEVRQKMSAKWKGEGQS